MIDSKAIPATLAGGIFTGSRFLITVLVQHFCDKVAVVMSYLM